MKCCHKKIVNFFVNDVPKFSIISIKCSTAAAASPQLLSVAGSSRSRNKDNNFSNTDTLDVWLVGELSSPSFRCNAVKSPVLFRLFPFGALSFSSSVSFVVVSVLRRKCVCVCASVCLL